MNAIESLHIDPAKKSEYATIVNRVYKDWYKNEWYVLSFREFIEISRTSFLMYLRYFLEMTTPDGEINLDKAQASIKRVLGKDFRQRKFDNAVSCIQDNEWESIREQAHH